MRIATTTKGRPRRRKPKLDPVTRYARAVVDGEVMAGRLVRLACARHLGDLERQRTPGFPFYFSAAAAAHVIDFFPEFLTLEDGSPFELVAFMQFCLGSIFGWKRLGDDTRRFQTAYIETGKGSGKTPTCAGVGLYLLAFDHEPAAEIYSAAFDKGQASIILNDAIRMAEGSPDLLDILDVGKYNLAHPESGSFFRAMSSEHRSKSGQRPHAALIDELHEHRDGTVVNKLKAGFKFRRQPLLLEITNSGVDRTSICWQHHEKSATVLEGVLADEEWFAYVCQLDPCDVHFAEGYRQPNDGCPDCDNWTDERVWPKSNPSLGVTIQPSYLRKQVADAQSMPADQALVKRLNFCLWTEAHQVWIPADRWDACRVEAVATGNPQRRPCAAALDLSSKNDISGLGVAVRYDDPPTTTPAEVVKIEGMDEKGDRVEIPITLNFTIDIVTYAWIPRETMLDRIRTERIPYDVWESQGHVFVTPGPVMDHQAIYEFVVNDTVPRFAPTRIGYDEKDATMLAVKLRDEARLGDTVLAVGQGKKLSEALKLITKVLVPTRRLRHNGNPVLKMCVANAEPKTDRLGAMWIEKAGELKRIDLAVCMAMAVQQVMVLPAFHREPQMFIVGGRAPK